MSLPQSEYKNIANAGSALLECADKSNFQNTALEQLCDVIGSESSVYYDISGDISNLQFKDGHSLGVPKEAPKLWCEHYQDSDPFVNKAMDNIDKGKQSTIVSRNVVVNREYTNSEFYCDFLTPQHVHHVMVIPITEDSRPVALIGLHRPAHLQGFSEDDIVKAEFVKPYIKAAIQKINLSTQLDECRSTIDTLISELPFEGVVVLDNDLIPVVVNEHIYTLIDSLENVSGSSPGSLTELPPEIYECCRYYRAMCQTTPISELREKIDFAITRGDRKLQGYVRAVETDSQDIFYIICLGQEDQSLISSRKLEKFNLTRREIDIVHLLSTGMTNPEMAKKLFISARTVQNHLRSIFTKVGVHNRTSLISVLARD